LVALQPEESSLDAFGSARSEDRGKTAAFQAGRTRDGDPKAAACLNAAANIRSAKAFAASIWLNGSNDASRRSPRRPVSTVRWSRFAESIGRQLVSEVE